MHRLSRTVRIRKRPVLHSSSFEIWSFCSKIPIIDAHDQDDWVEQAYTSARQSFLELLRLWEALQLHWYLRAIDTLIARNIFQPLAARPEVNLLPKRNLWYYAARAKTTGSTCARKGSDTTPKSAPRSNFTTTGMMKTWESKEHHSLNAMLDKFANMSLVPATNSRKPVPAPLRTLTGRIEVDLKLSQHRICCAAEYGRRDIFEGIIRDILSKCPVEKGFTLILETALREAAWEGNLRLVRRLVAVDTDINVTYECGSSASLHDIMNRRIESAVYLVDIGAAINSRCKNGMSALHYASLCALEVAVRVLLDSGADCNA